MGLLVTNIKKLCQAEISPPKMRRGTEMAKLPNLKDAYIYCTEDRILDFGFMTELPSEYLVASKIVNASDRLVLPGFCDSHTHMVYSGSREMEFMDKIKGLSYEEISNKGGGILNSAKLIHETSENELYTQSVIRVKEIMSLGTVAVEIKSGYGLSIGDELKMLRVIQRIKRDFPLTVKSTFLGAHTFPLQYRNNHQAYLNLIIQEMIPAISREGLADFIDVFCDKGFFSPAETAKILEAGLVCGMRPKIHANELDYSGGIQVGVEHDALSVDHLEFTSEDEINLLLRSNTMPTLLPGTSFFLGLNFAPARKMIDAGLPLALASDYNPGSSPSGNINFILALASIKLGMYPEEAINAVTLNSAYAMGIEEDHGSITPGKYASFIITKKISGIEFLPYAFGTDLIENVFIKGIQVR
jgi:imidazolonepropionase